MGAAAASNERLFSPASHGNLPGHNSGEGGHPPGVIMQGFMNENGERNEYVARAEDEIFGGKRGGKRQA